MPRDNKNHNLVKMCILSQLMLETIDDFEEDKPYLNNLNNLKVQTKKYNLALLKTFNSSTEVIYKKDDEMVLAITQGLNKRIDRISTLSLVDLVCEEIEKD
jgi:hypothetical protein